MTYIRVLRIQIKSLRRQVIFLTVCTFTGHREVSSSTVESGIGKALVEVTGADKEYVFYSGGMGDFDKKCEFAVQGMGRRYPERSIRLVQVLPCLTHEINRDKEYFKSCYDGIVVPTELMGIHYKTVIKKRNRQIVDQADEILAHIHRDFEGVFDTVKYAYRTGKPVPSFAMKE